MKRPCNEIERELLLKNKKQLLSGIYEMSTKNNYSNVFVGLFVSIIVMFVGIFPLVDIFNGGRIAFAIWVGFCFTVPNSIVSAIMNRARAKKEAKAFLKQKNLMVNGATIVAINEEEISFSYIEDDFVDEEGKPIVIDYPMLPDGYNQSNVGQRLLVMYDEDEFQLMIINDELRGIVHGYSQQYPLEKDMDEYIRVPHPNAYGIDYQGHVPSESEKETFANMYVKVVQGEAFGVMKKCCVVLFVCMLIISVILGIEENCLEKALGIGVAAYIGLILFVLLMRQIGKRNIKRQAQFTYVQEVVLESNQVHQSGKRVKIALRVYEWKSGQFEVEQYPGGNVPTNEPYGSVLYKFTNKKGTVIFIPKRQFSK